MTYYQRSVFTKIAKDAKNAKGVDQYYSYALFASLRLKSPPGADLARVALWGYDAAATTDAEWNTGAILRLKLIATATVAANAKVLDVVGTPELRREQQFQMIAGGENTDLYTDGCREDFLDAREKLLSIGIDIVADDDIAHAWMLADLHSVESRAITLRSSS
jgi:hypothetical protein